MRKNNEQTLKDVIQELIATYQIKGKLDQAELTSKWSELMGEPIARQTGRIFLQKKCLYIKILSAPLKQELFYGREKIIALLNKEMGEELIENIIFL